MNKAREIETLQVRVATLEGQVRDLQSVKRALESAGMISLLYTVYDHAEYGAKLPLEEKLREFKYGVEQFLGIEEVKDPPRYQKKK